MLERQLQNETYSYELKYTKVPVSITNKAMSAAEQFVFSLTSSFSRYNKFVLTVLQHEESLPAFLRVRSEPTLISFSWITGKERHLKLFCPNHQVRVSKSIFMNKELQVSNKCADVRTHYGKFKYFVRLFYDIQSLYSLCSTCIFSNVTESIMTAWFIIPRMTVCTYHRQ